MVLKEEVQDTLDSRFMTNESHTKDFVEFDEVPLEVKRSESVEDHERVHKPCRRTPSIWDEILDTTSKGDSDSTFCLDDSSLNYTSASCSLKTGGRKLSSMEIECRQELSWKVTLNDLQEILKEHQSENFSQADFVFFLSQRDSLHCLFNLFDRTGNGRLQQLGWIDTIKGQSRETETRNWTELLEVLTYVVCGEDGDVTEDLFTKILTSKGVLERLFASLNRNKDGYVTRKEIMDFIAVLTHSCPRTGITKENLDYLEMVFREALGEKKELTLEDFRTIIHSRNPFFVERVFEIFDRDDNGTVSLSEFLDAMHQFAGKSPNDKFKFLFKVYDLDGDGLIQTSELKQVLKACMEENGMRFSDERIEDLTLALFDDADPQRRGGITYEALKAQLERHSGLLENLSISIDQWLVPPKQQLRSKKRSLLHSLKSYRPYQLTMPYLKNNYVYLSFLFIYISVNVGLFVSRAVQYANLGSNAYTILARACGQCLNFNCAFAVVLVLRQNITFLRARGFGSFLPLDNHLYLHKICGWLIFIYSVLHTVAHLCNFGFVIVHDNGPGGINSRNLTYFDWILTMCPGLFGIAGLDGIANPTGVALIVILLVMVVCSQPFVRKSGYFEVFYWTHSLYIPFYILTILHGPNFWRWFIAPGLVFLLERAVRIARLQSGRGVTFITTGVLLPSKVIHLVVQKPANFHFCPGDYVYVNIPAIANYEWHPLTISSAPEQEDILWLHIRAVGQWTHRLYDYFEEQQRKCNLVQRNGGNLPPRNEGDKQSPTTKSVLDSSQVIQRANGKQTHFVNQAFETDALDETLESQGEAPPILTRNQSTPQMNPKKRLSKSNSVPNLIRTNLKKMKRERNQSNKWRAKSERRRIDQNRTMGHVLLETDSRLTSADESVIYSFRYMRRKPQIITLDAPSDIDEEEEDILPSPGSPARCQESLAPNSEGVAPPCDMVVLEEGRLQVDDPPRDLRKRSVEERRQGRISRLEEAEANGQCVVRTPLLIYLDGPYGTPSSHIFRAQHAVLIATGIGVTPFASILQSIMHKYWKGRHTCPSCNHVWSSLLPPTVMNLRKVDFFWINRDQRSFEWFVNLLSQLEIEQAEQGGVLDRFLDMHMYITSALQMTDMKAVGLQLALDLLHQKEKRDLITGLKTRTNAGRPNWDKVFKQIIAQKKGKVTVFYCGPPALGRTLRYKCDEYGFNFRKENF